jgi:hypothetical protein
MACEFEAQGFKLVATKKGGAMAASEQELKAKLNRETARIGWEELQRFYARGDVVAVAKGVDLIEVACHFSNDNKQAVAALMQADKVFKPDDARALDWLERKASHWAVVIAPWVLVQEIQ